MNFYTNVFAQRDNVYVTGYKDGRRYRKKFKYKPYLFVPSKSNQSQYKTLDGKVVDRVDFDSMSDARDFVKTYKDAVSLYGLTSYPYLFIYDYFREMNYDTDLISVVYLDIEVGSNEGFPDIQLADKPITAISLRKKGKTICFSCVEFKNKTPETVTYVKCKDEVDLLQKFLVAWNSPEWSPDIVSGWNIEFFDIPYLVNRIKKLLGEEEAKKLSPWRFLYEHSVKTRGRDNQVYLPQGIAILDYFNLYRKFTFTNHESYKLDAICHAELGTGKIDYSEYDSLNELYLKNPQKFIEYNIVDCERVEQLEDKLKFIEQVMTIAYDAKVNYNDTLTTVRSWDIIIHNYLMNQNKVIPFFEPVSHDQELIGGYVKEPKTGMYDWVVSFDLTSLYPHLIMGYNISPETFLTRLQGITIEEIVNGGLDSIRDEIISRNASCCGNLCLYSNEVQGFFPALMERMYKDRAAAKKKMLEYKKENEKNPSPQLEKLIVQYNNIQQAKKIQLNAAYGAMSNMYFRFFNFNNAESVTASGQMTTQWIEKKLNEYLNKILKTEKFDYVIAADTDSIYVNMDPLVKASGLKDADDKKITDFLDKVADQKFQPFFNKIFDELKNYTNAREQKMFMKRECIANKAIWTAKKRYILNMYNNEGVPYETPKLKMVGIEAVRSSTPKVCRDAIKEALYIIMNKDQKTLINYIDEFRAKFNAMPVEDIALPRTGNGLTKYYDANFICKKKTPIHVRGALIYNHLLKTKGLQNKYPEMYNGDKIKFLHLKMPNESLSPVISILTVLPQQFNLHKEIDYDTQFDKAFLEPLQIILRTIGWETEKVNTLEDLFG